MLAAGLSSGMACRAPHPPSAPTTADAARTPETPAFLATPHAFWEEPDILPVAPVFVADGERPHLRVRVLAGTPMRFGTQTRTSCGHDLRILERDADTAKLQAFTGGFEFHANVALSDLSGAVVLGPTLLYRENGEAFIRLYAGLEVEVVGVVDDTWSRVRLKTRPETDGLLRHDRLGHIYTYNPDDSAQLGDQTWLDANVSFDLASLDGTVRVAALQARSVQVLGRDGGVVEVIAPLDLLQGPFDAGAAEVHGFVTELPELESPPVGTSGWGGGGKLPTEPTGVAESAGLHAEPTHPIPFARADHENVSVQLVDRGEVWSRVEVATVWGPVNGFIRTDNLRPPSGPKTFLTRDMGGRCEQPAASPAG